VSRESFQHPQGSPEFKRIDPHTEEKEGRLARAGFFGSCHP
jgi:hypothetical protein